MNVYVFDASTIVSAALSPDGLPRLALATARAKGTIALSAPGYREIAEVLTRPKFARILTADRRHEVLALLSAAALWAEPTEKVRDCRDRKDNRYLELALAVHAAAIVSGDEDLLILNPWRGIRVLRPAAFVTAFRMDAP